VIGLLQSVGYRKIRDFTGNIILERASA
jgi:hypothetical protein